MNGQQQDAALRVAQTADIARRLRDQAAQATAQVEMAVKAAHSVGVPVADLAKAAQVTTARIYQHLQLHPGRNTKTPLEPPVEVYPIPIDM